MQFAGVARGNWLDWVSLSGTVKKSPIKLGGGNRGGRTPHPRGMTPVRLSPFRQRLPRSPKRPPLLPVDTGRVTEPGQSLDTIMNERGSTQLQILIVDDCRDAATTLAYLARLWGHEV